MWNITDALTAANSRSIAIGENSIGLPAELSRQRTLPSGELFAATNDNPVPDFGGSTEMGREAVSATSGSKERESGAPLGMLAMFWVLDFFGSLLFGRALSGVQY
ncbi:MAG TPA: hypothetical protein VFU50_20750 [Terriglobales bacterium]|nr:hypothetical protein [Terriglobales bacterium]